MTPERQKERTPFRFVATLRLCVFALILCSPAWAAEPDLAVLCADRAAIERIYYNHRTGAKPPFEETLPADQLRRLVQTDLAKEAALRKVYGVEITPAMLAVEVQRINTTTRAPDILAELKSALGNDKNRFARTVAKPIVVERILRNRFENDDQLHAAQRREVENVRAQLTNAAARFRSSRREEAPSSNPQRSTLNAQPDQSLLTSAATGELARDLVVLMKQRHSNEVTETTWQLDARPDGKRGAEHPGEREIRERFGPGAQILSAPQPRERDRQYYFEDLPGELQRVLRVQLRQPGDVSAVIETPGGFLLYVAKEKTDKALTTACLSIPKRSYEEWLAEQDGAMK